MASHLPSNRLYYSSYREETKHRINLFARERELRIWEVVGVAVYIWYDGVDANKSLPLIRAALVAPSCHVM